MSQSEWAAAERKVASLKRQLDGWQGVDLPRAQDRLTKAEGWRDLRIAREKAALTNLQKRHAAVRAAQTQQVANAKLRVEREQQAADRKVQLAREWLDEVEARVADLEDAHGRAADDFSMMLRPIDE